MASKSHILGLIILCQLLTGTSEVAHEFCSTGENIILSCGNALSDCTSTTWVYSKHRTSVELIAGKKKKSSSERLSLGSDCSLKIEKVREGDYGLYICQQYVNGEKQGNDALVYLHVLHVSVSPASTQAEIRPGSSLNLSCHLDVFSGYTCDILVRTDEVQLFWVNQTGVNLQSHTRYQISTVNCSSTLTTTLKNEDNNTAWTCEVTKQNKVQTSVSYTVKFSEETTINQTTSVSEFRVIIILGKIAAFTAPTVILLQFLYDGRADNRRRTQNIQKI